jgi:uncharacterized membrane protein SpoIIM required for sporulation
MKFPFVLLGLLGSVLLLSSDAYAYLDPGTGSLLLQGLLAAIAAAAAAAGLYWNRILLFFGIRKRNDHIEEAKKIDEDLGKR